MYTLYVYTWFAGVSIVFDIPEKPEAVKEGVNIMFLQEPEASELFLDRLADTRLN